MGAALRLAGQGLRGVGYKRVVFSLVDPERKRIVGEHEDSPTGQTAADMTSWELSQANEDIQPFVVATKKPEIVEDARTHPLTNKKVVEMVGLRGMAVCLSSAKIPSWELFTSNVKMAWRPAGKRSRI